MNAMTDAFPQDGGDVDVVLLEVEGLRAGPGDGSAVAFFKLLRLLVDAGPGGGGEDGEEEEEFHLVESWWGKRCRVSGDQ